MTHTCCCGCRSRSTKGHPTSSYPFSWAVYGWIDWIDGRSYSDDLVDDEQQAARDLARFVAELRRIHPAGAFPQGLSRRRGIPAAGAGRSANLIGAVTRAAIEAARGVIDGDAATAAWERALEAPAWKGTSMWIHADLLRPNVLVRDGQLRTVIDFDFGATGVGDLAADVIAPWSVFGRTGRRAFRETLDVDDGPWNRARLRAPPGGPDHPVLRQDEPGIRIAG